MDGSLGSLAPPREAIQEPRPTTSLRRRDVHGRRQFRVPYDRGLQRVSAPDDHVPGRDCARKLLSFVRIDDQVSWILRDRLVVRPLNQFLPSLILEEKVVFTAVVE